MRLLTISVLMAFTACGPTAQNGGRDLNPCR